MAETKLKPCPFCGGEAVLNKDFDESRSYSIVECIDCGAGSRIVRISLDYCADEKAIAAWNRRADNGKV